MITDWPLKLEEVHPVYGKVAMMGTMGGEPYYWFVDKHGSVAMMPASMFEDEETE